MIAPLGFFAAKPPPDVTDAEALAFLATLLKAAREAGHTGYCRAHFDFVDGRLIGMKTRNRPEGHAEQEGENPWP